MEDGVKEDTAKPKEVKFIGKEGWVKKSSGKFLGTYKDRYIQLEKTEIAVYEREDLKNCLERVDLENYDKCLELRSPFKKNRLSLIRAQKCGNKIHDVKIQAQNPEDRDAWIKALIDGINRAKNKILDEVKVDESCTLEHVTRTRPKRTQGHRPPTRQHMKEAANLSSDGILRKDDATDNTPNGTHQVNTEVETSKEAVKPPMPPSQPEDRPQEIPEAEPTPQKEALKPPMPPSKENKPSSSGEGETPKEVEPTPPMPPNKASDSSEEPTPQKEVLKPPMPPSKENKPSSLGEGETPKEVEPTPPMPPNKASDSSEEPTPQKEVLKPPMPPLKENKPSSLGEGETPKEIEPTPLMPPNKASDSSEEPDSTRITLLPSPPPIRDPTYPPTPPSKDVKPAQTAVWEVPQLSCGAEDSEEVLKSPEETLSDDLGKNDKMGSEGDSTPALQTTIKPPEAVLYSTVLEEVYEMSDEKKGSSHTPEESDHSNVALAGGNPAPAITSSADTQRPATPLTKSIEPSLQLAKKPPGPPAPPKKKTPKRPESDQPCDPREGSAEIPISEPSPQLAKKPPGPPAPPKKKPLNRAESDQLCDPREGSAEVPISVESRGAGPPNKSVPASGISDLSKHKDDLTPTAEPKNKMVTPSTGDTVNDDELQHGDGSEAESEPAEGRVPQKWKVITSARSRVQMLKQVQTKRRMQSTPPVLPLKPSKGKSASVGDLLSESMVDKEEWALEEISGTSPRNDTNELHNKVALELEDTVELLGTMSSGREAQGSLGDKGGPKSLSPEVLLAKAVEKLRQADQFLQEAKNLKQAQPVEKKHRMSL